MTDEPQPDDDIFSDLPDFTLAEANLLGAIYTISGGDFDPTLDEAKRIYATVAEPLLSRIATLERDAARVRAIVDEQAEMESLWCIADNIVEAHFQQELRRLHAVIEGDDLAISQDARKP